MQQWTLCNQGGSRQSGSDRRIRIGKRPWDMPRSQSSSVFETWTHADFAVPILDLGAENLKVGVPGTIRVEPHSSSCSNLDS
jgi:hypothetical protein